MKSTYWSRFKNPSVTPVFVDLRMSSDHTQAHLVPPTQSNKKTSADILYRPEIEGDKQDNGDEVENKVGAEPCAEQIREQGC